jgi:hypothetical protein
LVDVRERVFGQFLDVGHHLVTTIAGAAPLGRTDLLAECVELCDGILLVATRLLEMAVDDHAQRVSLDRVLQDGSGGVRNERVVVQAKHWLANSVGPAELQDVVSRVKLWRPIFRGLVVATSGRFSADAVAYAEQHNDTCDPLLIDLWPASKLETMLAKRPALAAAHGLR